MPPLDDTTPPAFDPGKPFAVAPQASAPPPFDPSKPFAEAPKWTKESPYTPRTQEEADQFRATAPPGSFIKHPKTGELFTQPAAPKVTPEEEAVDLAGAGFTPGPKPPSALGAAGRGAVRGVVPAAGGIVGMGAGAAAGAAAGAFGGPLAPVTVPAGAIVGGLAGGFLGSYGAGKAQEEVLKHLPEAAKEKIGQSEEQRRGDIEAHPYASMVGELLPNLGAFVPAASRAGATIGERVLSRGLPAGLMGGQEAATALVQGEPVDPAKVAIAAGAGALMNRPTRLGDALTEAGASPVRSVLRQPAPATATQAAATPAVAAATPPATGVPAVGETIAMPIGGDLVPMIVAHHTPEGDVILRDANGTEYRMPGEQVARIRQPLPEGTPPTAEPSPPEGEGARLSMDLPEQPSEPAPLEPAEPIEKPGQHTTVSVNGEPVADTSQIAAAPPPPEPPPEPVRPAMVPSPPPSPAPETSALTNLRRTAEAAAAGEPIPTEQVLATAQADLARQATLRPGGFRTAKGSAYEVHEDGTTTRNKSYHPEHGETDQGPQPRSEQTFYVTPEDAQKLGEIQSQGGGRRIIDVLPGAPNMRGIRYLEGPDTGKFERRTVVNAHSEPAPGLTPVELWNGGSRIHFGNPITEVAPRPEGGGAPAMPPTPPALSVPEAPGPRLVAPTMVDEVTRERLDRLAALEAENQMPEGGGTTFQRAAEHQRVVNGWVNVIDTIYRERGPAEAENAVQMIAGTQTDLPPGAVEAMRLRIGGLNETAARAAAEQPQPVPVEPHVVHESPETTVTHEVLAPTAASPDVPHLRGNEPAPRWMVENTPEGRRQLAVAAGFPPAEALRLSKMNWSALEREPAIVARLDEAWRRGQAVPSAEPAPTPEAAPEVRNAPIVTDEQHTKTKKPIFAVRFPEKPAIEGLGSQARKMGGQWSSYRGDGMRPGWMFKTREAADRFAEWARGELSAADFAGNAETAGRAAFSAGAKRVPANDPALARLLRQHGKTRSNDIITAWLKGWDQANVAEPVPGVSTAAHPEPAATPAARRDLTHLGNDGLIQFVARQMRAGEPVDIADVAYRNGSSEEYVRNIIWPRAEAEAAIGRPTTPPQAPEPAPPRQPGWEEVGKNYIGQTLYEDHRGVRSIVENGVRSTEPVGLRPTRGGVQHIIDRNDRPEYKVDQPHPATGRVAGELSTEERARLGVAEPSEDAGPTRGTRPAEDIGEQVNQARERTEENPTDGQIESGNYPKGRVSFHGIPFVMENPVGTIRRGVDANGEPWSSVLPNDYGYISRTEGADGEHVDAYLGPHHESQQAFVVDQVHADTGAYDEAKVMLGYQSWPEAREAYEAAFSDERGAERLGNVTPMSLDQLKTWLREGDTKNPIGQGGLPLAEARSAEPAPPDRPRAEIADDNPSHPPAIRLANAVARSLEQKTPLDARGLQAIAEHVYGSRLAEGKFTRAEIYDALELGVNRYIAAHPVEFDPRAGLRFARQIVRELGELKKDLPTQTVRAGEKDLMQQFSTPPDYAFTAAWAAKIGAHDSVLEPSAGTGSLVAPALNAKPREVVVNELSKNRAPLVESLGPARSFRENAEQLHNVLPQDVRPSVVLMNPPFSSAGERMAGRRQLGVGAQHIEAALERLDPGGRLVAIVGRGMRAYTGKEPSGVRFGEGTGAAFREWWDRIGKEYDVRANVGVPGEVYQKYGTTFGTQLLVIDKNPPSGRAPVIADATDIPDLMEKIAGVRDDRLERPADVAGEPTGQPVAAQPGRQEAPPGSAGERVPGPANPLPRPTAEPGVRAGTSGAGAGADLPGGTGARGAPVVRPEPETGGRDALVPQQPERPGPGGADQHPPATAGEGVQLAGSRTGPDGVVLRPEGSAGSVLSSGGEPPNVTPESVRVDEIAAAPRGGGITDSVYEPYTPQRIKIAGAQPHPGALVQSTAMASVLPPPVDYAPRLPKNLITSGALSDAQLEAITYAGQAHSQMLPVAEGETPYRRGYFIGDGCVASGTRIYNPLTGEHTPIEELVGKKHAVLSLTPQGFRPHNVAATFLKGEADLYRVRLDDGRQITVTQQHRFLTLEGWQCLDVLRRGMFLACAHRKSAISQSSDAAYAQHGWRKAEDCLDRCSEDYRPYGGLPLPAADSDQSWFPSPDDAPEHTHPCLRKDAPEPSLGHIPRDLCLCLPSKNNYARAAIPFHALTIGQAVALLDVSSAPTLLSERQFDVVREPPHRLGGSTPRRRLVPVVGLPPILSGYERLACVEGMQSSETSRRTEAQESSSARHVNSRRSHVRSDRTGWNAEPCASDHYSLWRQIVAIEFVRRDKFYDMYVPGPENYVAEGFVNHNTGVGKGREVAGIMLDNWQQGRRKALWVSEKQPLINDAKRDWKGIGGDPQKIFSLSKTKAGADLAASDGIAFATYDTLRSSERLGKDEAGKAISGKSRIDQIVDWLGKDFDGVIAFDESHALANSIAVKGTRGVKDAAQKALAGVDLQDRLPNARVIYVSATGATEVSNLAYADRLGLWGRGTAFANKADFISQIHNGGIAAMELVARDMKAMGSYIARSLSYDDVRYDRIEHTLTPQQRQNYDALAEAWQMTLHNFEAALVTTAPKDSMGNPKVSGGAKAAALSAYWGAHQRFFNQIITAMQMPSVIRSVERDLAEKRQAVLQLVNTNEASQKRGLAKIDNEADLEDLDMSPADQLMQMVKHSFPVVQHETYIDDNGNERSRPVRDSQGNLVENKQAIAMREALLDQLGAVRKDISDGPLEMLINHFGPDQVAEVTGRKQRVVKKPDEKGNLRTQVENRSGAANVTEADAFQNGKKPILVFSQAGGTGRSYHADNTSPSKDAQRSHYLVQAGWRADTAIQGFGRTHRTNQASAPIYHLVTTDLEGQRRFISSIARRLAQLGALTKGERRAGEQGMFSARDNLESTEAGEALYSFFRDLHTGKVPEITEAEFAKQTGLKLTDENGNLRKELPPIPQFLNRLLSMKVDQQNAVFGAFERRLNDAVDRAAAAGTLDVGTETLKGDRITKDEERTVHTDPGSGAETKYVRLKVEDKNIPASFDDISTGKSWLTGGRKPVSYIQNQQTGRVYAVTEAHTATNTKTGAVTEQYRIAHPMSYHFIDRANVVASRWRKIDDPMEARALWDKQVAETPEYSARDVHLITGAVLPIWDRLAGTPKVYRTQTEAGEGLLGRVVDEKNIAQTLKALGAEGAMRQHTPQEIADRVLDGDRATLANGWALKRSQVAGEGRIELTGPGWHDRTELAQDGIFSERIGYDTRYFVPTGEDAAKVIERVTARRPVTEFSGDEGGGSVLGRLMRSEEGGAPLPASLQRLAERIMGREGGGGEPPPPEGGTGGAGSGGERPRSQLDTDLDRVMHTSEKGWFDNLLGKARTFANDRPGLRFERYWLDQDAALRREENKVYGGGLAPGRISPFMSTKFARNWRGALNMALDHGQIRFGADGQVELIPGTRGLRTIFGDITEDARQQNRPTEKAFAMWWITTRSGRLIEEGRERNVPPEMIERYKNLDQEYLRPDGTNLFRDVHDELQRGFNAILDLGEQGGVLNAESRALWQKNDYAPFYRVLDEDGALTPRSAGVGTWMTNPIKQLKGGPSKINNVYENTVYNYASMISRAMANKGNQNTRDLLLFNTNVLRPLSKDARVPYGDPAVQESLRAAGLDPASLSEEAKRGAADLFGALKRRDPDVWPVFDNGKPNYYQVTDPLMLEALTSVGTQTMHPLMSILTGPARMLRQMVVFDPAFALAHNFRMAVHAWNLTGVNPIASFAETLKNIRGPNEDAMKLIAAGAMSGKYDIGLAEHVRKEVMSPEYQASLIDTPLKAMRFIREHGERLMQASDIGPRIAVYKQAIRKGMSESEALNAARDLIDFSTHGNGGLAILFAQTIPFLNARWQGLGRSYRGLAGSDRNAILMRGSLLAAATLANWYINKDDPEYQRKEDWDKQFATQIKIAPGVWMRAPRHYEFGAMFMSLPEMMAEYYDNGSMRQLQNAALSMLANTFKFNPIPVAVRPGVEVMMNHDTFTGQPIVNEHEAAHVADMMYGPSDSHFVVAATQAFNSVSPYEVAPATMQHLIRGYFAGMGAYVTGAADYIGEQTGALPSHASAAQTPVLGRFLHETPEAGNRLMRDYYDLRRGIDAVGNSIKDAEKNQDKAMVDRLMAGHPEFNPALEKRMNAVGLQLSKMRGVYQHTEMNPGLSKEQKTAARTTFYNQRDAMLDQIRPLLRQAEGLPARP